MASRITQETVEALVAHGSVESTLAIESLVSQASMSTSFCVEVMVSPFAGTHVGNRETQMSLEVMVAQLAQSRRRAWLAIY